MFKIFGSVFEYTADDNFQLEVYSKKLQKRSLGYYFGMLMHKFSILVY